MPPHPNAGAKTILVVDDSKIIHTIMKVGLRRTNAELRFAGDGVEALGMIEQSRPDLLVLDIMMPRMDGMALLAHLDAREVFSTIPRIILTARVDLPPERRRFENARTVFMNKPISLEELRALIEEALESGTFASRLTRQR